MLSPVKMRLFIQMINVLIAKLLENSVALYIKKKNDLEWFQQTKKLKSKAKSKKFFNES